MTDAAGSGTSSMGAQRAGSKAGIRAVTFDAGQTLIGIDTAMLAARVIERGGSVSPAALEAGLSRAWQGYASTLAAGGTGESAWKCFMRVLLDGAACTPAERAPEFTEWLWSEQPRQNLWRRPIAGMFELARELRAAGVPVGILSNSEGKLEALIGELGQRSAFDFVADSGALGFEKPGAEIFHFTARQLGVEAHELLHIGDSLEADVQGALNVGAHAIWFNPAGFGAPGVGGSVATGDSALTSGQRAAGQKAHRVLRATSASELREHLVSLGVLSLSV